MQGGEVRFLDLVELVDHHIAAGADAVLAARLVIDAVESLVHRIATDVTSGIPDDVLTDEITRMVVAYLTA